MASAPTPSNARDWEVVVADILNGGTLCLRGAIDNGFYGDSEIYVGGTLDLDDVFKGLQSTHVELTIRALPRTAAEGEER